MPRTPSPSLRALWRTRLAQFDQCDLTVQEFCDRQHVSVASFYHWRRKLAEDAVEASAPQSPGSAQPKFVPVILSSMAADVSATLRLPGGAAIDLPASLDDRQLIKVIAACVAATNDPNSTEVTA